LTLNQWVEGSSPSGYTGKVDYDVCRSPLFLYMFYSMRILLSYIYPIFMVCCSIRGVRGCVG
jgi:hypothetical protein